MLLSLNSATNTAPSGAMAQTGPSPTLGVQRLTDVLQTAESTTGSPRQLRVMSREFILGEGALHERGAGLQLPPADALSCAGVEQPATKPAKSSANTRTQRIVGPMGDVFRVAVLVLAASACTSKGYATPEPQGIGARDFGS